ncbi:MAG: polyamine ABC-transporter integral rane protein [Marmoricola sp.]|jgi:spermidine/putrescine transport system permease protein|nr:polyamine ABC-transporter integral rane protein [Marmoricola sp.]
MRGALSNGLLGRLYTWLVIAWLSLPILVMIVFGFNDTKGKFNFVWQGWTLRWYRDLFAIPDLTTALRNSLTIALIVTLAAAVMGTMIGYAMGKYSFRGRGVLNLILFANVAAPEIAMGTGLLSLFLTLGIPRGYWTVVIAHIMFDIVYVAITVQARMSAYDRSLEEAAHDLGAGAFTTFRLVTLPVLLPGVIAGSLLAFALSIDDFIITEFNAGTMQTFPLWVYGSSRVGTPPQVNVMGTLVFAFGVVLVLANTYWLRRTRKQAQAVAALPI